VYPFKGGFAYRQIPGIFVWIIFRLNLKGFYPLQKNIMWILWGSYCILTIGGKDRIKKNINDSRVMKKYYKEK